MGRDAHTVFKLKRTFVVRDPLPVGAALNNGPQTVKFEAGIWYICGSEWFALRIRGLQDAEGPLLDRAESFKSYLAAMTYVHNRLATIPNTEGGSHAK